MGKITVILSKENEEDLRKYIADHYSQETYGKLSKIINEALKYWMMKF